VTISKELQNVCNANPHAPNAGAAAAFPRLNGDSFQKVGLHPIPTLPLNEPPDKPAMRLPNQVNGEDIQPEKRR
jgi:hypothetical protein